MKILCLLLLLPRLSFAQPVPPRPIPEPPPVFPERVIHEEPLIRRSEPIQIPSSVPPDRAKPSRPYRPPVHATRPQAQRRASTSKPTSTDCCKLVAELTENVSDLKKQIAELTNDVGMQTRAINQQGGQSVELHALRTRLTDQDVLLKELRSRSSFWSCIWWILGSFALGALLVGLLAYYGKSPRRTTVNVHQGPTLP